MISKKQIISFYIIIAVFVAINAIFILSEKSYLFSLFPLLTLVLVSLVYYPIDKVLFVSVCFIPFSIPLKEYFDIDFNLDVPTEPLFIFITLIFALKLIRDKNFDKDFFKQPITLSIIIYIFWQVITTFTSTIPIVSIKHIIMQIWFIVPFFFLMSLIVKNLKNVKKFLWLYIIPLTVVIIIIMVQHYMFGFTLASSAFIQKPFFYDHTSYGATLAMFIPVLIFFCVNREEKKYIRMVSFSLLTLFIVALIFSYTRAAWVSLAASLALFFMMKFRLNYRIFIVVSIVAMIGFFIFQKDIFMQLSGNKQDSSDNLMNHVASITNVSTDASNLERINRWNCAIRMYEEKPFFGWGPGTYQFEYAPFQNFYEKTYASTNNGDEGNAHSDYLGALAETGLIGMLSYIFIVFSVIITAIKTYNKVNSKSLKLLLITLNCSLFTYFVHGFLNNFLDKDKIAVAFWAFIAVITVINLYHSNDYFKDNKTTCEKDRI